MARPNKHEPFRLPDGRETPVTLQKRGGVYRVKFKAPGGAWAVKTTGETDIGSAWKSAGQLILATYTSTLARKPDPRKSTWEKVLAELPTFEFKTGTARPRALEAYTSRLNILRELLTADGKATTGPNDVSVELAKRFRHLYTTLPFTKSKKEGAKQYKRSAETVRTTLRILTCLWNHCMKAGLATANPWEDVGRPSAPKMMPTAPSEDDVAHFFQWVDAKGWELVSVFFRVKAFVGCRTDDLCQATSGQFNPKTGTLRIRPEDDKTNQERVIPLPEDLAARLNAVKGKTYLWERYTEESQKYRPGRRNATEFRPSLMYWFVDDVCPQYRKAHPDRFPITPHDLRRRTITLGVIAEGGNVFTAAKALGVHPDTAQRHYIDAQKAFDTDALFRKLTAFSPK